MGDNDTTTIKILSKTTTVRSKEDKRNGCTLEYTSWILSLAANKADSV